MKEEKNSSIVDELQSELVEQETGNEAESENYKEKYLYAMAEIENLKKRHLRETDEIRWKAGADAFRKILDVADALELAVMNNQALECDFQPDDVTRSVMKGFELIEDKLKSVLKSAGCEIMEMKTDEGNPVLFDTDFHDAVSVISVDDESLDNRVVDVRSNGYLYKGRVLRHANVVVGRFAK